MKKSELKKNSLKMDFNNLIQTRQNMSCNKVLNTMNSKDLRNKNLNNSKDKLSDMKS